MKRVFLIVTLIAMLALPTGTGFAQDGDFDDFGSPFPPGCDPEMVLNDLIVGASFLETADDVENFLFYAGSTLLNCGPSWVDALINGLLGGLLGMDSMMGGMMDEPMMGTTLDPNDGVMTPEEAEFVMESAFTGNFEAANEYLCLEQQIDSSDLIGGVSFTSADCYFVDENMACDLVASVAGEEINETLTFEIVNGQLCENVN